MRPDEFDDPFRHGFLRVAAAVPHLRVGDPAFNAARTIELAGQAATEGAALVVFPELGLTGYSSEDLFGQQALLDAASDGIVAILAASTELSPVLVVGAPVTAQNGRYNAAVVIHRGRVLGAVPKSYIPEYLEYYEKRHFRAGRDLLRSEVRIAGETVPFSSQLLFACLDLPDFVIHVEICEDLWAPVPPSTFGAMAGATVIANPSASTANVGKAVYRRTLCEGQSARTLAGYVYAAAGLGESTTDVAWDGHALICENGTQLAESVRYSDEEQLVLADLDLDRITADRRTYSSFGDAIHDFRRRLGHFERIEFSLTPPAGVGPLRRHVERFPYVPANRTSRNERCEEVYNIQVRALQTRMSATGIEKLVIGVSGGLDSTHALIVAARVMDRLGLPRSNVLGYTLPGFATSRRTLRDAHALMRALDVSAQEIDIRPSARQMLEDIGHPAADGSAQYDIAYENVQAGERTSHLFRLANHHGALVLGTGDLSELALGWSTYGVGDQMSHYNVNASVPKTLIQFMLRWAIDTGQFGPDADVVLASVLGTEISPELIPPGEDDERPTQTSESTVGPYELQDFFLYYVLRFGYRPSKVAYLARAAWGLRELGEWPDLIPPEGRNEYSLEEIRHWLEVFARRFFQTSQFKRSALPNGPKIGSGGSLSPRADWRAPSDGNADAWLSELRQNLPAG